MKLAGTAVIGILLWMILIPTAAGTQQDPLPQRTLIVGTITNATSETYLNQIRISALAHSSTQEALAALREGTIQGLVYDAPILRYYIQQNYSGSLQVLPIRLLRQDYGIALQPNSPPREKINVVLLQKIREKSWQDKIFQYLGE